MLCYNVKYNQLPWEHKRKERKIRAMKIAKLDKTSKLEKPQMLKAYTKRQHT